MTRTERGQAMRRRGLSDAEIGMRLQLSRQRVHVLLGPRPRAPKAAAAPAPDSDLSAELQAWRERHGLTQAVASAALGCSMRTLQGWERGRPCGLPRLVLAAIKNYPK